MPSRDTSRASSAVHADDRGPVAHRAGGRYRRRRRLRPNAHGGRAAGCRGPSSPRRRPGRPRTAAGRSRRSHDGRKRAGCARRGLRGAAQLQSLPARARPPWRSPSAPSAPMPSRRGARSRSAPERPRREGAGRGRGETWSSWSREPTASPDASGGWSPGLMRSSSIAFRVVVRGEQERGTTTVPGAQRLDLVVRSRGEADLQDRLAAVLELCGTYAGQEPARKLGPEHQLPALCQLLLDDRKPGDPVPTLVAERARHERSEALPNDLVAHSLPSRAHATPGGASAEPTGIASIITDGTRDDSGAARTGLP